MSQDKEENLIRAVLKNAIAQVVAIVTIIFSLVRLLILPIQEIQINLAQVQRDLVTIKDAQKQVITNTTDISIIKEQIKELQRKQN